MLTSKMLHCDAYHHYNESDSLAVGELKRNDLLFVGELPFQVCLFFIHTFLCLSVLCYQTLQVHKTYHTIQILIENWFKFHSSDTKQLLLTDCVRL